MSSVDNTIMEWALKSPAGETIMRTIGRRSLLDRAAATLFALVVLAVAAVAIVRPDYNWDMVAYIATAIEGRHATPETLHAETWAAIDARADQSAQAHLKQGYPYNLHQWENPADFQSQLSMYRVKLAYVWLLGALEPITGLVTGAFLLSVVPAVLVGGLALFWLWREGALQGAVFLMPVLLIGDYAGMAAAVTPDLLLAVVSLASLYALWRGRDWIAAVLLFGSVFIRPDNIILIFALLIAAVLFGWRKLPMIATFVISFAACMFISRYGDHPGWWAHFYFSTVQIQNNMAGFHPDLSVRAFATGYARGILGSLYNDWPALLALLTAGWALLHRSGRMGSGRANAIVFACAIGALGKFASFPLPDDRFYFVFLAGMAIALLAAWKPSFGSGSRPRT